MNLMALAKKIEDAAGPEEFKHCVEQFLDKLVEDCNLAADHASSAWQERAPGKPWEALARKLGAFHERLQKFDPWR